MISKNKKKLTTKMMKLKILLMVLLLKNNQKKYSLYQNLNSRKKNWGKVIKLLL